MVVASCLIVEQQQQQQKKQNNGRGKGAKRKQLASKSMVDMISAVLSGGTGGQQQEQQQIDYLNKSEQSESKFQKLKYLDYEIPLEKSKKIIDNDYELLGSSPLLIESNDVNQTRQCNNSEKNKLETTTIVPPLPPNRWQSCKFLPFGNYSEVKCENNIAIREQDNNETCSLLQTNHYYCDGGKKSGKQVEKSIYIEANESKQCWEIEQQKQLLLLNNQVELKKKRRTEKERELAKSEVSLTLNCSNQQQQQQQQQHYLNNVVSKFSKGRKQEEGEEGEGEREKVYNSSLSENERDIIIIREKRSNCEEVERQLDLRDREKKEEEEEEEERFLNRGQQQVTRSNLKLAQSSPTLFYAQPLVQQQQQQQQQQQNQKFSKKAELQFERERKDSERDFVDQPVALDAVELVERQQKQQQLYWRPVERVGANANCAGIAAAGAKLKKENFNKTIPSSNLSLASSDEDEDKDCGHGHAQSEKNGRNGCAKELEEIVPSTPPSPLSNVYGHHQHCDAKLQSWTTTTTAAAAAELEAEAANCCVGQGQGQTLSLLPSCDRLNFDQQQESSNFAKTLPNFKSPTSSIECANFKLSKNCLEIANCLSLVEEEQQKEKVKNEQAMLLKRVNNRDKKGTINRMVDLNSATNRLQQVVASAAAGAGGCANSWRPPNSLPYTSQKAASYKVAQKQQLTNEAQTKQQQRDKFTIINSNKNSNTIVVDFEATRANVYNGGSGNGSGSGTCNRGNENENEQEVEVEVEVDLQSVSTQRTRNNNDNEQEQNRISRICSGEQTNKTNFRLTRPGRSPVSLQRQTNARLARHKHKLQVQRQEQLANLEQRERGELLRAATSRQQQQQRQQQRIAQTNINSPGRLVRSAAAAATLTTANNLLVSPIEIVEILDEDNSQQDLARGQEESSYLSRLFWNKFNVINKIKIGRHQVSSELAAGLEANSIRNCQQLQQRATTSYHNAPSGNNNNNNNNLEIRLQDPSSSNSNQHNTLHRQVIVQMANSNNNNQRIMQQHHSEPKRFSSSSCSSYSSSSSSSSSSASTSTSNYRYNMIDQNNKQQTVRKQILNIKTKDEKEFDGDDESLSTSSSSTLSLNKPFCKICHLSSTKSGDKLISPCKCSGTMQYIHCGCLLKWLEISNRANEKAPLTCELCAHEYTWHKRFNFKQMKLPRCSYKDIFLHILFVLALCSMLLCALTPMVNSKNFSKNSSPPTSTVHNKNLLSSNNNDNDLISGDQNNYSQQKNLNQQQQHRYPAHFHSNGFTTAQQQQQQQQQRQVPIFTTNNSINPANRLASEEKLILICAAGFFIAFFIAIYAQTKARDTLYGLIVKFTNMNLTYYITEYDHGTVAAAAALASATDTNISTTDHCQQQQLRQNNDSSQLVSNLQQQSIATTNYCATIEESNRRINAQCQSSQVNNNNYSGHQRGVK